jgi:hypothetical protein
VSARTIGGAAIPEEEECDEIFANNNCTNGNISHYNDKSHIVDDDQQEIDHQSFDLRGYISQTIATT